VAWSGTSLARLPRVVFGIIAGLTAVAFVATGVMMHNFQKAWDILTGSLSPFGRHDWVSFPLAVLGYLFVPTAIALILTDQMTRFTRSRLVTLPEAKDKIADMVEHIRSVAEAAAAAKAAAPGTGNKPV
jgi:hypothetical protein